MIITLTNGMETQVDRKDFSFLNQWKWNFHKTGYVVRSEYLGKINGKYRQRTVKMHRLIMDTPDGLQTDHINGDTLDNRRKNLRNCTQKENQANQGIAKSNKSGYKGVFNFKGRWQSGIYTNGKKYHLGCFDTSEEAALAYNRKAKELFGNFARLNKVSN